MTLTAPHQTTNKTAIITGITGQDGSYLAELLLGKGYTVYGIVRRSSTMQRPRIDHLHLNPSYKDKLFLVYGDLSDSSSIDEIINRVKPDEFYNLGAQSHVKISFEIPEYTIEVTGNGAVRVLEAIRQFSPKTRFYQASSSEMFGKVAETPQNERTRFHPRSPYACAKVLAHNATVNYRESYGLFACCGILFNHESERRGDNFVTMKIALAAAKIAKDAERGEQSDPLMLGNLDARRDWGYAPEYVEAMWRMLQHDTPDDYVIATGETHTVRAPADLVFGTGHTHSVREFCELAFKHAGLDYQDYVKSDPKFFRPAEVDLLVGDPSKARKTLGWTPRIAFTGLVRIMTEHAKKSA